MWPPAAEGFNAAKKIPAADGKEACGASKDFNTKVTKDTKEKDKSASREALISLFVLFAPFVIFVFPVFAFGADPLIRRI